MQVHVLHTFAFLSAASAACLAATNPSMKVAALRAASTKGGGSLRRPPPFVDPFMGGFVAAKEAADAADTTANVRKTSICMHIGCATSDHHRHPVQTHSNLFKLVQTCSNLLNLVQTCSNMFKPVQTGLNEWDRV